MEEVKLCKIKKEFFDTLNVNKEGKLFKEINTKNNRMYLCLMMKLDGNQVLIPLETNLHKAPALLANSLYELPSNTRPNAGLNLEKLLIVNDNKYLEIIDHPEISHKQMQKMKKDIELINKKTERYIHKYKKACERNKENEVFIFKFSTLHLFKNELGI